MKSLLLSLSILACLWVGCSGDGDGMVDPYEVYFGLHVVDTVGLKVGKLWGAWSHAGEELRLNEAWKNACIPAHLFQNTLRDSGNVYLIGTRNGKLWIGKFDFNTREQLHEWTSREDFPLRRSVDLGYGKIDEYEVDISYSRGLEITVQDGEHIAVNQVYYSNNSKGTYYYDSYFAHGDDIEMYLDKEFPQGYPYDSFIFETYGQITKEWLSGYVVFDEFYSREGELLGEGWVSLDCAYPISMGEAVIAVRGKSSVRFWRENVMTNEVVWEREFNLDVEEDARVEADFSSLELWIYTVKITHRDGTTETRDFRLNVENGWIEEI